MKIYSDIKYQSQKNIDLFATPALPLAIMLNGQIFYLAGMSGIGVIPSSITTGMYYLILALWSLISAIRCRSRPRYHLCLTDFLFMGFMFSILLSVIFYDISWQLKSFSYLPFFVIVPYLCARLISRDQIVLMIQLTVVLGLFLLLLIIAWLLISEGNNYYLDRPLLFGYDHTPLTAGIQIGSVTVLMTSWLARPGNKFNTKYLDIWCLLLVPLNMWMLQYIGSRGGFYTSLLLIITVLFASRWLTALKKIALLVFIIVSVISSYQMLPKNQTKLFERILPDIQLKTEYALNKQEIENAIERKGICKDIYDLQVHGHSISIRKILYFNAYEMFIKQPLTGVGAGGYGNKLCEDDQYFPHSTLLQAFAELGIVGGACLGAMMLVTGFGLAKRIYSRLQTQDPELAWFLIPLWGFYLIIDQLYGSYFLALPFFLLTGACASYFSYNYKNTELKNG